MFLNRTDAGRQLASGLAARRVEFGITGDDLVVVGLPRGGLPIAYEVARELGAPLDVILVRKLGVPFQPELAMGAIGENAVQVVDEDVVGATQVTAAQFAKIEARERVELDRRASRYRTGRPRIPLTGRVVVIVDDGIATGSTAMAACQVAAAQGASKIILAVPLAPDDWSSRLAKYADVLFCLHTPTPFGSVGRHYRDFSQTTDDAVIDYLDRAVSNRA